MTSEPKATPNAPLDRSAQLECEEPLMRVQQSASILCVVHERIFREDPAAADAVALAQASLSSAVEELRKTLRFSSANPQRTA